MEFKVGDWVRHSNGKPFKIKAFEFGNFVPESTLYKFGAEYHPSYIKELWQPEVGEYIWTKTFGIQKVHSVDNNEVALVLFHDDSNLGYEHISKIEPFIGELPSFIKDCQ